MDEALCAVQANLTPADALDRLCKYVDFVIEHLPQTFGERFHFDAALVQAICSDSGGSAQFSGMIVPRYGRGYWAHERVLMPSEDSKSAHFIDLIHFPGHDQMEDVDLLDYPWLLHELGHHIFSRDDSAFAPPFTQKVDSLVRSLRLRSIADRGAARLRSDAVVEDLARFWRPTREHGNWAHELAIDLIALWLGGPAYIACVERKVASENPYKIEQAHPPYAVRVQALAEAAEQLGFGGQTDGLVSLQKDWRKSWDAHRSSRFLSLASRELIVECTRCALAFSDQIGFRKCAPEAFSRLRNEVSQGNLSRTSAAGLGLDLLVEAYLVHCEAGESAYEKWAAGRIKKLTELVMQ